MFCAGRKLFFTMAKKFAPIRFAILATPWSRTFKIIIIIGGLKINFYSQITIILFFLNSTKLLRGQNSGKKNNRVLFSMLTFLINITLIRSVAIGATVSRSSLCNFHFTSHLAISHASFLRNYAKYIEIRAYSASTITRIPRSANRVERASNAIVTHCKFVPAVPRT